MPKDAFTELRNSVSYPARTTSDITTAEWVAKFNIPVATAEDELKRLVASGKMTRKLKWAKSTDNKVRLTWCYRLK